MKLYHPDQMPLTPYLFYTGKGGVGKTTIASATAVQLANKGKRVILVSTDPASNLQDVFETELSNKARPIVKIPNLKVANFNPDQAVDDYKERVIGPYRDILPSEAIDNMEEQLSGSCTLEVAQFNEFAFFLSDPTVRAENDYIIFDTAPTGHTLRMLELPSAWTSYFDENTTGTSCMGQLSGLTEEQERYELALKVLNNPKMTTLFMVTRPQGAAIAEANRSLHELSEIGIQNHQLIINGLLENANDEVAETYRSLQIKALDNLSDRLQAIDHYYVPLRPYSVTGVNKLKIFLEVEQDQLPHHFADEIPEFPPFERLIDDLIEQKRQIIFTMGKGGVGKTSVAVEIAHALSDRGQNVRLATTDPADHLHLYLNETKGIKVEHIDEKEELRKYSEETLAKSREFMDEDQLDYVKEDLKSPCTQEIAVFKAFAKIVDQANENETIVIDTAPTGHTILLLDSSRAYSQEIERSSGDIDPATQKLLPRIQSDETEVVMVTLAEATPYYETHRLAQDLDRANINHHWWLINQSMLGTGTQDLILGARAYNELEWIKKIDQESNGDYVVLDWNPEFKSIN